LVGGFEAASCGPSIVSVEEHEDAGLAWLWRKGRMTTMRVKRDEDGWSIDSKSYLHYNIAAPLDPRD